MEGGGKGERGRGREGERDRDVLITLLDCRISISITWKIKYIIIRVVIRSIMIRCIHF